MKIFCAKYLNIFFIAISDDLVDKDSFISTSQKTEAVEVTQMVTTKDDFSTYKSNFIEPFNKN